ncbi:MAG: hypothetical protein ACXW1Z_24115 [Methylobacter sp.]
MALSDLIHKNKSKPTATLTNATLATYSTKAGPTVAEVAKVAVANHTESKTEPLTAPDTGSTERKPVHGSLNPRHKAAILRWIYSIGETDQAMIDDVLDYCTRNPEAQAYYLKRAEEVSDDDRHYCRECLNLRNGYCTQQRFRPVDDIPRRCEDFRAATLNDSRNIP